MKKIFSLFFLSIFFIHSFLFAQIKIGEKTIDTQKVIQLGKDLTGVISLTEEEAIMLGREAIKWMDKNNIIANDSSKYSLRLKKLTKNLEEYKGMRLNYKVYLVKDINAFACADGSIRIFSPLMDILTDEELLAIIGHEIGHIAHKDTEDAIEGFYIMATALNAVANTENTLAKISVYELNELMQCYTNVEFSRQQEYKADDYAFQFCMDNGITPYAIAGALEKLVIVSKGEKSSTIQQMLSTHPDTEERAARMREKADSLYSQ